MLTRTLYVNCIHYYNVHVDDIVKVASQVQEWGDFIVVLLHPFDLQGKIFRRFGTGSSAKRDLLEFVRSVLQEHNEFAFLLKELQPTASTGISVRTDNQIRVELIHGHFITKGHADPTVYELDEEGNILHHKMGTQKQSIELCGVEKVNVSVQHSIEAHQSQLIEIAKVTMLLSKDYPECGVEFGFTLGK